MKKKLLSLVLALMMCLGLCVTAFAESAASSNVPRIGISLPDNGRPEPVNGTYQLRAVSAAGLTDKAANTTIGYVVVRESEPTGFGLTTFTLPLGSTISISNLRNDWSSNGGEVDVVAMQAYSDPDGDGIYDQWIYNFENDPPVVPLTEDSVAFPASENGKYSNEAVVTKDNGVGRVTDALPGSVTLTADYLSEMFGPNTLVLVQLQVWTAVSTSPLTAFQTGSTATMVYLIPGEDTAASAETESPAESETPETPAESEAPAKPAAPAFTDVAADAYYAAPVAWAVEKEITTGTSATTFSPKQDCTNAQILTFLWRACGKPEPGIDNPFTNTFSDAYLQAAIWAYEQGMVSGETFGASQPCTRAMAVTYIWQACGSPAPEAAANFTDVPADAAYAQAVAWAVEQGVTTGTSDTTFSPDGICNRGQIVTFLQRAMG